MEKQHFEPEFYRTFFGIESEEEQTFAEEIIVAVEKIDRALAPRQYYHPYIKEINLGNDGVPALIKYLGSPKEDTKQGDVLDAFAYIFIHNPAPAIALTAIRSLLTDEIFAPIAARTLAIGKDQSFLADTMQGLGSDDPGAVASAATLMGYGQFEPALPILHSLVSPTRFIESQSVIWALGEIGDMSAIPLMQRALAENFRVTDAMIALGKIGAIPTIHDLVPYILKGDTESREVALRSLNMILQKNENLQLALLELSSILSGPLKKIAMEDSSKTARFHALLCLSKLGEKLGANQLRSALDMSISENEMSAFQSFFIRRNK